MSGAPSLALPAYGIVPVKFGPMLAPVAPCMTNTIQIAKQQECCPRLRSPMR